MKFLILILLMFASLNSFSQDTNCKTKESYEQNDIIFCNENLNYSITTKLYNDVLVEESLPRSIEFTYIEEAVRLATDVGFDYRFDYEPSTYDPGTIDLIYPDGGEFIVFLTTIDNKKFVFVHWADIDDGSFSIVFESPESYEPVYSIFEN